MNRRTATEDETKHDDDDVEWALDIEANNIIAARCIIVPYARLPTSLVEGRCRHMELRSMYHWG